MHRGQAGRGVPLVQRQPDREQQREQAEHAEQDEERRDERVGRELARALAPGRAGRAHAGGRRGRDGGVAGEQVVHGHGVQRRARCSISHLASASAVGMSLPSVITFWYSARTASVAIESYLSTGIAGTFAAVSRHSAPACWPPRKAMGSRDDGVLLRGQQRREVAERAQRVELGLAVGRHEADELPGLGLVRRALGDRVERAAVRREDAAGQRRRAPLAGGVGRKPVLQVAGEPRAHHLAGDPAGAEARDPFVGPHRGAGVDAGAVRGAAELEGAHEAGVVDQHLAVAIEVDALAGGQVGAQHDVDDVVAAGQDAGARRRLELDAGGDERGPVPGEVGLDEPGLGDEVGAVQEGAGADVGRQRAELALGVGGLRQREGHERRAQGARVVRRLVQVLEAARPGELADELEVDGHHVGQVRAGGQVGGHLVVVVGVLQRDDLDVDVRDARHASAAARPSRRGRGRGTWRG